MELENKGGLGNNGEAINKNYKKALASLQEDGFKDFIERIEDIILRSDLGVKDSVSIVFNEIDSSDEDKRMAARNAKAKQITDLIQAGVISADEARESLIKDEGSGFNWLTGDVPEPEEDDEELEGMIKKAQGSAQDKLDANGDNHGPDGKYAPKGGGTVGVDYSHLIEREGGPKKSKDLDNIKPLEITASVPKFETTKELLKFISEKLDVIGDLNIAETGQKIQVSKSGIRRDLKSKRVAEHNQVYSDFKKLFEEAKYAGFEADDGKHTASGQDIFVNKMKLGTDTYIVGFRADLLVDGRLNYAGHKIKLTAEARV
jgi:hypothetical protein